MASDKNIPLEFFCLVKKGQIFFYNDFVAKKYFILSLSDIGKYIVRRMEIDLIQMLFKKILEQFL